MTADVYLVPHTHWDREWYEPFQRFRLRLVDLMDDVTSRAQREPGFCFTMDGQMAAVDDYLEVRPEQREVIRGLVGSGQLAIGPWRVLLDEFLCSGENIVRNLEMGWNAASELGVPMPVGYLPDMFGHCAQMPQILALAGLRHACLWRGVPSAVDRHAFTWRAPDGTGLRTEYLPGGYGNAADLFAASVDDDLEGSAATTALLTKRLRSRVAKLDSWFGDDPFLAMYGTDHAAPLPTLMEQVALLADGDGTRVQVCTLTDYVLARDPSDTGLPVVEGELRSHARANILPGVLSVRWHLKEAMARAERMVERYAEPFAALWSAQWPVAYLELAWRRLVDASCHDSVTGCGVDETALQVAARIAEAEHAGQAVRDAAAAGLARAVSPDSVLVLNPTPAGRTGLVSLDVPVPLEWPAVDFVVGGDARVPAQEVGRNEPVLADEQVDAGEVAALFRRVHDRELFGQQITHVDLDGETRSLDFHVATRAGGEPFDVAFEQQRAAEAAAAHPGRWRVRTLDEPRRRLVALLPVPALGWTTARPVAGAAARSEVAPEAGAVSVTSDDVVDNGLLSVAVRADGALRLEAADGTVLDGVGRLVDGGDCGDTYNYGPPARDVLVDEPERVDVDVLERGPLRAVLVVTRRYSFPARSDGSDRSARLEPVDVVTRVELRRDEPFVRLRLRWENRSQDHRLRLHVPLGRVATRSHAEGQFAVVERGLVPEGGTAGEHPIATCPASGFVDAGGAGVLLGRTVEYELLEGGELAITVLRAVGRLSRNVHPYRDEPAGPQLDTPEAQVLGPAEISLAVLPHAGSWEDAGLVGATETFRHGLLTRWGSGPDRAGLTVTPQEGLRVTGEGVTLTSLRRRGDRLELRVVAQTDAATVAEIGSPAVPVVAGWECDLLGREGTQQPVGDGVVRLPLRPWQIATLQLRVSGR